MEYLQIHWNYINNIVHLLEGGHWKEAKDAAYNTVTEFHRMVDNNEKLTDKLKDAASQTSF